MTGPSAVLEQLTALHPALEHSNARFRSGSGHLSALASDGLPPLAGSR